MLSTSDAAKSLEDALAGVLADFRIDTMKFGRPSEVEKAAREAHALFQGVASGQPRKEDSYAAALAFMRSLPLDEEQYHLVAGALCEAVQQQGGARLIGHRAFDDLLQHYETEAKSGELWRLTWYGLLASYFSFDPVKANPKEQLGWVKLREMLRRTWPDIDAVSGTGVVPDWMQTLRKESQVLTDAAADKYSLDYLQGNSKGVDELADDLGIPSSSWFWHSLVLSAVRRCCELPDADFKNRVPRLLQLLDARRVFRDDALELILTRYQGCSTTETHGELRDFVVRKDVWRNPKLKAAGIATAWNRVATPVWQMVLGWVNEANLKLFFEVLAGRSGSDEGRLEFWSRYLEQITWTRLVFGSETMELARSNGEIRSLIAQEEGAYATLRGCRDVDAFMMQIGEYLIVEFSKTGHACNIYEAKDLQFDRNARSYSGGTDDLKYGFRGGSIRISHSEGWKDRADEELQAIGIYPDKTERRILMRHTASRAQNSARNKDDTENKKSFTLKSLTQIVKGYRHAYIDDRRTTRGGRLWVEDPVQHEGLATVLKSLGFRWANGRSAWYYPED